MRVYFALRKQSKDKHSNYIITLMAFDKRFPGRKFSYSTGKPILKNEWRIEKPSKSNKGKSLIGWPIGKESLLPVIEHLTVLKDAANKWAMSFYGYKGSLSKEDLHQALEQSLKAEENEQAAQLQNKVEFFTLWKKIITETKNPKTGEPITDSSKRQKSQSVTLLSKYCKAKDFTPTLQNIDMNFYHSFDTWMRKEYVDQNGTVGLEPNTRGKHFKELKAFMRECVERDYENVNRSFQKKAFKVIRVDVDDIYLTKENIQALINLNYTGGKAELLAHYVVACFTGLRHSDWRQHDPANIVEHNGKQLFKIKVQKTGEVVYIPLHPVVKKYLSQYGKLKNISNQKMNKYAKEFCADANIKDPDSAGCHTTRRTFCTLAYLSKSLPTHTIMKISGHNSEASFLRYLKLGSLDHAIIAADSDFFNDESFTTLKVA